ncbi:hypothetical protein EDP1_3855 [Pseudomonas putida S610]|nr:hypothetical protein EDP1_3855 [Pseudomonas putida S610]
MIDTDLRPELGQRLERHCAITHGDAVHPRVAGHLQIERRISDHQRTTRFDAAMVEYLLEHQWVRLAARLIRRTRDIEKPLEAVGLEHPVKAAARLAGSHRHSITLSAKSSQRFDDAVEQRRGLLIERRVDIGIVLTKALYLLRCQTRIKGVDRLGQRQPDDPLDGLLLTGRLAGTLGSDLHGFDDAPDGVGQGTIPVEDQQRVVTAHSNAPRSWPTFHPRVPPT